MTLRIFKIPNLEKKLIKKKRKRRNTVKVLKSLAQQRNLKNLRRRQAPLKTYQIILKNDKNPKKNGKLTMNKI